MTILHLPATGYVTMPWKNGTGSTEEICLLPKGASRDAFELRVSRATISSPDVFSSFAGAERTITLIEGHGLTLQFDDHAVEIAVGQPHSFDSGLTPVGVPKGGQVRVLNVMDTWQLGMAEILSEETLLQHEPQGPAVVFALRGDSKLSDRLHGISLAEGDCALLDSPVRFVPHPGSTVLLVPLRTTGA
ncbi:hypothetical protein Amn_pb00400 (plasmid) [Aminobacter sp. Y103A]|uniref:HutD/Ves family protein n=1 Tax=Aminobacter sp. Y103A TaxID=1870862 RepID=UPI0025746EF9|nr:HutD family protein [Aminobacter sp. SS-2016]BBD41049.1 hypothetical protein Amn_pb00400 [Aminobacter sp. SS-2016]